MNPHQTSYLLLFFHVLGFAVISPKAAVADRFGTGDHAFEIEFVTIGDPGNPADTVAPIDVSAPLPSGTVDYVYRMAKYEISEEIIAKVNALSNDALDLQVDVERGPQKPATGLSWFDAARFVNWLNEEAGSPVAYKFADQGDFQLWEPSDPGYNPDNLFRNSRARYFLPSADEWHKAAYYDPINERYWLYPYGNDDPPTAVASGTDPGTAVFNQSGPADVQLAGGISLLGAVALAGNVAEWEETSRDLTNGDVSALRGQRGSNWLFQLPVNFSSAFRNSALVGANQPRIGIRVASIPEPTVLLLVMTSMTLFASCRWQ